MACSGCAKRKAALIAAGKATARAVRRVMARVQPKPRVVPRPKDAR